MAAKKKALKKDLQAFQKRAAEVLQEVGATALPSEYSKQWGIETKAGPLAITVYDDWIATQFEDPKRAEKLLGAGNVNPYSGKWNFHFGPEVSAQSADSFGASLKRILVVAAAESNPCPCRKQTQPEAEETLKQKYRRLEVLAQRNSAEGKQHAASIYKRQAQSVLQQAVAAGEPWASRAKENPTGLVKVTLPSGNLGVYDVTGHARSSTPQEVMRFHGHIATKFQGVDGTVKWHVLRPGPTREASDQEARSFDSLPLFGDASNPVIDPPQAKPGELVKVLFPSGNWGVYRASGHKPQTTMEMIKLWDHIASTSLMPDGKRKWFLNDHGTFRPASKAMAAKFEALPVHGKYESSPKRKGNPCGCREAAP